MVSDTASKRSICSYIVSVLVRVIVIGSGRSTGLLKSSTRQKASTENTVRINNFVFIDMLFIFFAIS